MGPRLLRGARAALRGRRLRQLRSADDHSWWPTNYGASYDRLAAVKRRYDPDNLFHLNQNIEPRPVPSPRDSTA